MKNACMSFRSIRFPIICLFLAAWASTTEAEVQPAQVLVQDVKGAATCRIGGRWQPVRKLMALTNDAVIKTGADATVDLLLYSSRSALRLRPNSELRLDKLTKETGQAATVTETRLTLISGSIAGTQWKLAAPSSFQIQVAGGVATIVGTEYLVRSDGAVTCVSGSVEVNFNMPGRGGSIKVIIPAGYSFDPATGQVVATTPAFLQGIIADIDTTRHNAMVFKTGGATVVVKPEKELSPHTPP